MRSSSRAPVARCSSVSICGDGDDKWLTLRKLTPTATGYIGETFYNVKVAGITLASCVDRADRAGSRLAGRRRRLGHLRPVCARGDHRRADGETGWDYETALPVDTIPHAGCGFVKLGACSSSEIRYVRDLQISLGGNMTKPQDMTMIGQ